LSSLSIPVSYCFKHWDWANL